MSFKNKENLFEKKNNKKLLRWMDYSVLLTKERNRCYPFCEY